MHDFFKGWRRKAGCVALLMALAVTNVWLISNLRCYELISASGEPVHIVTARKDYIRWSRYSGIRRPAAPLLLYKWPPDQDQIEPMDAPLMRIVWDSHWAWGGFEFGDGRCHGSSRMPMGVWAIPYWSVACPLALLSAYLILWKPRTKPPQNTSVIQSPQE